MINVLALTVVNPEHPEALQRYLSTVPTLVAAAGGKYIHRYVVEETLIGTDGPQRVTMIEFPRESAAQSLFESSEYLSIVPARDQAFSSYKILLLDDA